MGVFENQGANHMYDDYIETRDDYREIRDDYIETRDDYR